MDRVVLRPDPSCPRRSPEDAPRSCSARSRLGPRGRGRRSPVMNDAAAPARGRGLASPARAPGSEVAGHTAALCLIVGGAARRLPEAAAPFSVPSTHYFCKKNCITRREGFVGSGKGGGLLGGGARGAGAGGGAGGAWAHAEQDGRKSLALIMSPFFLLSCIC